jgi:putative phosphoribosyl transferase
MTTYGRFQNRAEAGRALAKVLVDRVLPDPIVLALPRGGVPVAAEVARALQAPLDLVLVRKIGVEYQPELAVAAVVDGEQPEIVVNEQVRALSRAAAESLFARTAAGPDRRAVIATMPT